MKNINKLLKRLSNSPFEELRDELNKYSTETLELFAVKYAENLKKSEKRQQNKENWFLDYILRVRFRKMNKDFKWTNENKQIFLNINNRFMEIFEASYNEALSIASELENKIKNNDKFTKDYEIEILINTYMDEKLYDDDNSFAYILSESEFHYPLISYNFCHSTFKILAIEPPIYLDKSLNWNNEYFNDTFKDNYICYITHELLEQRHWSFYDIINIKTIWADVKVRHQSYIENI